MAIPLSLDANIELALRDPAFFVEGRNLSIDELGVIRVEDTWKVALVNNIEQPDQDLIDTCMQPLDPRHYCRLQVEEWFGKERFFLQTKRAGPVGDDVLIEDAIRHRNLVRYRLCYTLNHPAKIAISTGTTCRPAPPWTHFWPWPNASTPSTIPTSPCCGRTA
jgi:hypothetical protein